MSTFIHPFQVDDHQFHFHFSLVQTPQGESYYVSILEKPSFLFQVKKANGRWRIVDAPKVDQWLHSLEAELHSVIESNHQA